MPTLSFDNELEVPVRAGSDFVQIFERNPSLPLRFGCRGGECGACAIEVHKGQENLTSKSIKERLTLKKKGLEGNQYRLACQCALNGDVNITPLYASVRNCSESQGDL